MTGTIWVLTVMMALGVVGTLWAERRGWLWTHRLSKTAASLCFIALAVVTGAHTTAAGQLILAALVASLAGDVALVGTSRQALTLGIVAFIGAHVLYCAAFVALGLDTTRLLYALPLVALTSAAVGRLLLPHATGDLRIKALVYVCVISVMVTLAAAVSNYVLAAAAMFYVSDIFVARQRFVERRALNRMIGLPIYYAAQWLFAFAVR